MGFAIHPSLIILLILLGAGLFICAGYGVHRLYGAPDNDSGYQARTTEQDDYMREVRARNVDSLYSDMRGRHYRPSPGPSMGK
ncbi:hypothetical protein P154DRAFT_524095 [Amniculicola lignicola CBS 123094]|uniref:Uncharacterized protein n=1 Tax=Amniculicola lignicola CBS 123094 TaxID=1392246 RepID=A0A6A5WB93_9PLEO|nr:hypothetical protein P154DRAFT_524095 [Amniculicola lignicola CBS 123094]